MKIKRPFDAVVWWEIRRIPYNLIMLVVGLSSLSVYYAIGNRLAEPGDEFDGPLGFLIGGILYGIMANIFYTLSWVTEIVWSDGDTSRTEMLRRKIFRRGLIVSVVLTTLPAVVGLLAWAFVGFK
jgi:hypothetical protein